jgi:hypothetical protein
MTQLEAFIYYLKQMDLEMLNDILSDDIFYCGTTKKIFLEKLDAIFEHNISLNNKTLAAQRSKVKPNCIEFVCWNNHYWKNALLVSEKKGAIISFISKRRNESHYAHNFRIN